MNVVQHAHISVIFATVLFDKAETINFGNFLERKGILQYNPFHSVISFSIFLCRVEVQVYKIFCTNCRNILMMFAPLRNDFCGDFLKFDILEQDTYFFMMEFP